MYKIIDLQGMETMDKAMVKENKNDKLF